MGLRGYIDNQLLADETILYRAHISWIPVIIHVIPFLLVGCAVAGVIWTFFGFFIALAVILLAVVIGLISQLGKIMYILGVDIVVTNVRFHSKKGLIKVQDDRESNLSRIDDTDIDFRTIWQRIFKYGDIEVQTLAGSAGKDFFKFQDVARPRLLKRAINQAKDEHAAWGEKEGYGVTDPMDVNFKPRRQR